MIIRSLFIFGLLSIGLSYTPVLPAQEVRIFDCVRFAENGNDIIVDSGCLVSGLRYRADPNWINRASKRHVSTLFHFVQLISLSRDPRVVSVGTEAVKTLIDAGAKLQPIDAAILFWPISRGHVPLVRILLELGASASAWPNDEIGTALTPVETAAAEGHDQIVELLVKHGAVRPSAKVALQERFVRSASFGSIEELVTLVTQGATVNGKSQNNEVALVNALGSLGVSDCKALAKIRWLLENGADPNLAGKGIFGTTPPLHQAVWVIGIFYEAKRGIVCAEQILRELIKHGAHVAARDSTGQTPLHVAAERNYIPAARLLLESGSTVMPRDKKGRTPLDMAESSEMIKLLKQHGATER
jgi:ankyrin repeat protein